VTLILKLLSGLKAFAD